MKIYLRDQLANPAYPPKCVYVKTGSALPVEFCDLPCFHNGLRVIGVKVSITNANGISVEAPCEKRGARWFVQFAASNFTNYGFVYKGFKVTLELKDDESDRGWEYVAATGDIDISAASATALPGNRGNFFMTKDGELFVRSHVVEGVPHFVKQEMVFDPNPLLGWGAKWTGDYILSNTGDYIPANQEDNQ